MTLKWDLSTYTSEQSIYIYNINALCVALEMRLCPFTEMKHACTDLLF